MQTNTLYCITRKYFITHFFLTSSSTVVCCSSIQPKNNFSMFLYVHTQFRVGAMRLSIHFNNVIFNLQYMFYFFVGCSLFVCVELN